MITNERTLDVDFFTAICRQPLQTAEAGFPLRPVSKATSRPSFPHLCLRHCLICESFIWTPVEAWRHFVIVTDWSWHILTFSNIWHAGEMFLSRMNCSLQTGVCVLELGNFELLFLQSVQNSYPIIMWINQHFGVKQVSAWGIILG